MNEFLEQLGDILKYIAIFTGVVILITFFVFTLKKLTQRDLSDQTGWRNFKKPIVGVLFITLAIQLIVIVFTGLYAV